MKNITLSIDEDVLVKVRLIAEEQKTTINSLVRDFLTSVATRDDRWADADKQMESLAGQSTMVVGPQTWTRDDLHER